MISEKYTLELMISQKCLTKSGFWCFNCCRNISEKLYI